MKKRHVIIIAFVLFGLLAAFAAAAVVVVASTTAATTAKPAQTADEQLKKGDEFYAQHKDAEALEAYLAAVQVDPKSYEAAWKACRSMIDMGDLVDLKAKGGEEKQKKFFKDSEAYARKAVGLNPNDTQGHFFLSAALGKYALMLGKKDQIAMSREIKTEIEKAIELDPTNDLAYHALGRWHRRIAEIGGAQRFFGSIFFGKIPKGSFVESEQALKKAAELKPDYLNHHIELARTYVAMDKYKEAVAEFQKTIDLPTSTSKDPEYKKEAEAEMAKAKKKVK
jgi:tetratricopeptide (TPR) repeat protein